MAMERTPLRENLLSPGCQNLGGLRAPAAAVADCDRVTGLEISLATSDHEGTSGRRREGEEAAEAPRGEEGPPRPGDDARDEAAEERARSRRKAWCCRVADFSAA